MGLLKRLFSMGSKKHKKQRPPVDHDVPLPEQPWTEVRPVQPAEDEEHEAAVSRLLRSSSARYVASSELDFATLPPLPHPINRVIHTPASSTISLGSASVSQRGTYNVTVHGRTRHPSTDFGNARHEPDEDKAARKKDNRTSLHPVDDSRVLRLRSDPSVASLIDLYDDHGKLAADAFSNSPPSTPKNKRLEDGRAQVRRNGSTLRQLLGASSSANSREGSDNSSVEGDISWAERFLAETEAASSRSSLILQTPIAPSNTQLPEPEISFVTDASVVNTTFDNPAISSMEVELSLSADHSQGFDDLDGTNQKNYPYSNSNPSTPQRASQVFGFLTKGKQSKPAEDLDRSLPEVPSCFSTPSDENPPRENHISNPNLPRFQINPPKLSAMPYAIEDTPRNTRPQSLIEESPSSREPRSAFSDDSHDYRTAPRNSFYVPNSVATPIALPNDNFDDKKNTVKVIMNGPTKVIVTAPTPSTNQTGPPRLLRGPRAPPRKMSNGGVTRRRSALGEVSNSPPTADPFMVPPSPRKRSQSHRRSNSQSSSRSSCSCEAGPEYVSRPKKLERVSSGSRKENQLSLAVKAELPSTPLRSNSSTSRSLLRTVVQQAMFRPPLDGHGVTVPSPASSSEMSPYGRQMMSDVRQQRMRAREADRLKHGSRYAAERDAQRI
ncbi:hypothetical protein JR316_0008030 [Psilocybe cubensis]|uniref:Uncharacterized protein n=2 Tax=Psilocybe cubensis TaxID=181762 RepID=A0ACB8GUX8_PSICU|nr:hypothetical protein JR316_0008030 [Psilocybe cubensis]KAH9479436.1 hypothetical protein JR316_0008030 [Psilocybe cubensis]